MTSVRFIRSASAVAIISLFAGCSTWDNMVKTTQGTTVAAAPGEIVVAEPASTSMAARAASGSAGAASGMVIVAEPAGTSMSTSTANRSTDAGITSTARNTTNSGINEVGTVATNPTYGGGTPKSAITAAEAAAQNYVAMNQAPPTTTAQSAPPQSPPSTSPQRSPSAQNALDVMIAQQALQDEGYNVGPIDGKMGPKTAAALRKFQKDHGIQATGRLDSRTLAALNGSSGSAS